MWLIILSNVDHSRLINAATTQCFLVQPILNTRDKYTQLCGESVNLHEDLDTGDLIMGLKGILIFYSDPSLLLRFLLSCSDVQLSSSIPPLCQSWAPSTAG